MFDVKRTDVIPIDSSRAGTAAYFANLEEDLRRFIVVCVRLKFHVHT
jgi:hypothetical protein